VSHRLAGTEAIGLAPRDGLRCGRLRDTLAPMRRRGPFVLALFAAACASSGGASARDEPPPGSAQEQRPPDRYLDEEVGAELSAADAKALKVCLPHGREKERTTIAFEISGREGRVRRYTIVEDAGNPAFALCLAEAIMREARFRKVGKETTRSRLTIEY
jgi:hypothetical protein